MTTKTTLTTGLAMLLLVGCASTPSARAQSVRESDDRGVEAYAFVGNVHGSSMMTGVLKESGRKSAVAEALDDAAAKGATHVVWQQQEGSYWGGGEALGRAYRCGDGKAPPAPTATPVAK